ncbi:MAG TPA: TlyA family RNA methyltransferase [Burkholderiaceae bacterium]|nr:TlyA family RNA methyltransferase [Burkholderiaceae bacterium]
MRADQLLVQRALAPTRSAAQRLIDAGAVRWLGPKGWAVPRKAGEDLPEACRLEVTDDAELRFASRGGLKLDAALTHCGVDVDAANCLDVGQSTGGFTDALLQRGAARVVGLDVGRGQLAATLAGDARVRSFEGLNARDVAGSEFEQAEPAHSFDLVVADLSFISLTLVLGTIARYLAPTGNALLLVKPQFELQPADIGKRGLVKQVGAYARVEQRTREACAAQALAVRDYFASAVVGGDGNQEFFVWARPA